MEEDKNFSKSEEKVIVTKILSDILDSVVPQPVSSTSKESNETQLTAVRNENSSENISKLSNPPLKLQDGDSSNINKTDSNKKDGRTERVPFETCTVKEILNEILDCTVIRKPSPLPSTSQRVERNLSEESSFSRNLDAPPEYFLDPRLIPRQIYNIRSDTDAGSSSRMQSTVKEVLNEILDCTVFKKSLHTGSCRTMIVNDFSRPSTSQRVPDYVPQREFRGNLEYQIYRSMGAGIINSTSALHEEAYLQRPSIRSLNKILPTYSTVLKLGPPKGKSFHSATSFIPKLPPPSYAEVEGLWEDAPSLISSESVVFGPDPAYMVCPRCRTVVVTDVETQRSSFTHLMALILCLCMCWPCCLLPYCLRSCNYTYHTCPNCRHYFGMYRPF